MKQFFIKKMVQTYLLLFPGADVRKESRYGRVCRGSDLKRDAGGAKRKERMASLVDGCDRKNQAGRCNGSPSFVLCPELLAEMGQEFSGWPSLLPADAGRSLGKELARLAIGKRVKTVSGRGLCHVSRRERTG